MRIPRPPKAHIALALFGATLVVASIHGVLPLGGIVAQILGVAAPLGATACFAGIVALRASRADRRTVAPVLDPLTELANRDGLLTSSTGCIARRRSTRRRS